MPGIHRGCSTRWPTSTIRPRMTRRGSRPRRNAAPRSSASSPPSIWTWQNLVDGHDRPRQHRPPGGFHHLRLADGPHAARRGMTCDLRQLLGSAMGEITRDRKRAEKEERKRKMSRATGNQATFTIDRLGDVMWQANDDMDTFETTQALLEEIDDELARARAKFPGDNVTLAALMEEVGELAKATFEEPRANVREEAVQVAVMAMRMVLDGDHTFDAWRASKGLDPLVEGHDQ
ncbi:hypothetical protein EMVG_00037 [Emiliania huxleyi virus PS401]|nr:hypothetical protein EMVG_00037 [Emiliania huxleyi virus PS401]